MLGPTRKSYTPHCLMFGSTCCNRKFNKLNSHLNSGMENNGPKDRYKRFEETVSQTQTALYYTKTNIGLYHTLIINNSLKIALVSLNGTPKHPETINPSAPFHLRSHPEALIPCAVSCATWVSLRMVAPSMQMSDKSGQEVRGDLIFRVIRFQTITWAFVISKFKTYRLLKQLWNSHSRFQGVHTIRMSDWKSKLSFL